jgi:ribonuclease PH
MRFGRRANQIREITIVSNQSRYAEGSCLFKTGWTNIHCTATVEEKIPSFLRGKGTGWITAEYSMLPRATHKRVEREATKGKQSGRTQEIQRLIGRSLRMPVDTLLLGERQIIIDCDVITADGGTRTASINGGFHAMYLALQQLTKQGILKVHPVQKFIGAISAGISRTGEVLLDLDYNEDSSCIADANFVLDENGNIIEAQTTCESNEVIPKETFDKMFLYAKEGINLIIQQQKEILL